MVYEKCYDPESIPTGARRMGGVPRGKEFAPEGQKLVANYIRRFFLLARLPDNPPPSVISMALPQKK
jgi:hypothetical protein